ncbi:MAG TPA: hypothetical protein VFC51_05630 [Chloroflexota bacterium]|nr:hypothetical protein [Chloroflexota bacterium]
MSAAASYRFDPDRVAALEAAGWRAYYDRAWPEMFRILVRMCQEQFHIPFPTSLVAAFHVVRGSMAWAPIDHDERAVLASYVRFYRLVRRYSGLTFDPERVAELELRYYDVHRRLVGHPDKTELIETMTALHSALFGLTPEQARESAELRVLANNTVDAITTKTSDDPERDWRKLEAFLRECYLSVQRELSAS